MLSASASVIHASKQRTDLSTSNDFLASAAKAGEACFGYGTAEAVPFHKTLKLYEQPLVLPQLMHL